MSQVTVTLDKDMDRIVGIVKSLYGFSSKSKAIEAIISEKGEEMLEGELKPEFIEKVRAAEKRNKFKTYHSIEEFRKAIEHA